MNDTRTAHAQAHAYVQSFSRHMHGVHTLNNTPNTTKGVCITMLWVDIWFLLLLGYCAER